MQGLDPIMDGILDKMNDVIDNTNLRNLQEERQTWLNPGHRSVSDIIQEAIRHNTKKA